MLDSYASNCINQSQLVGYAR